jgi:hypothetical protein
MLSIQGIEDFSITRAAMLDDAAIVAYVAEGQAELCEFPVGGLHPLGRKFGSYVPISARRLLDAEEGDKR